MARKCLQTNMERASSVSHSILHNQHNLSLWSGRHTKNVRVIFEIKA